MEGHFYLRLMSLQLENLFKNWLSSVLEERLYRALLDAVSYGHHAVREVQLIEKQKYTENELVISFEEDGR